MLAGMVVARAGGNDAQRQPSAGLLLQGQVDHAVAADDHEGVDAIVGDQPRQQSPRGIRVPPLHGHDGHAPFDEAGHRTVGRA